MSELRELYQEMILDHGKAPRNFGHLENADREAHGDNPLCGDRITVWLHMDGDTVQDISFEGQGCAISMASSSMMTEIVKGKSADKVKAMFESFHRMIMGEDTGANPDENAIDPDDMDRLMVLAGVKQFPMRVKCATLAWHTVNAALEGKETISTEDEGGMEQRKV